jgi:hypothetical protein
MTKKTTKYDIESLSEIYAYHAVQAKKFNDELIAAHQENYPDDPIPAHYQDDFCMATALKAICDAIIELRKNDH